MGVVIRQFDVFLIDLDPTVGHEIQKRRPALLISPDEMNNDLETVLIAPMTTKSHPFPWRVPIEFDGKKGWVVLDQIRSVDRLRLVKRLGRVEKKVSDKVRDVLLEMFEE
jgi:mRNA interferase MazF